MDGLKKPRQTEDPPPLPASAPLEMPTQDLRRFTRRRLAAPPPDTATIRARLALGFGAALVTAALAHEMWRVLAVGELNTIELAMLVLFILNIGWIVFGTASALLGLVRPPAAQPTEGEHSGRTALLIPIYNEDATQVVAAAAAMLRALATDRPGDANFDAYLLSDTTDLSVWLTEQALVDAARADPLFGARLFYRHRLRNAARKSGNVRDWVERWGGAYGAFIILDADSLMEPETIQELARRMMADGRAGIIQTSPVLVGGRTPFGRLQQFASRVYGPLNAHGLARWFGDAGNYWGHNAIIRTRAFAASAGLPVLGGAPPFGGHILSHDFVEAALVRRAGYSVRMADDLRGSYEHAPPNLIELAARDRRWCQGNLQHVRLLFASGLHPLSRMHFAMGAFAYLASLIWLLFLLAGMALALYAYLTPPDYFADTWSLFPTWPRIDSERAITLFGLCMFVLFLPKFVGLGLFLRSEESRGGRALAVVGFFIETILSALIAPVTMLTQTRAILEIVSGRDSGWAAQARDAARLRLSALWRFHRLHMAAGVALALAAGAISWSLLAWMSPALIGLVFCIPIAAFLGDAPAGDAMGRLGLLVTPEEKDPPAITRAVEAEKLALLRRLAAHPVDLAGLLASPGARRRHLAWLDRATARRPGEDDPQLASALLKFVDGAEPAALNPREAYAVAASAGTFEKLA
ncbi:glucans biosynthesis glucosyltransferase MdoH [Pikeienuella sp. HZG-20]|uniref:glucans biosynthesis glucosyltransferase MdoH n=1 Tax=Paludibacillus litoralis TaxID=3133267 RepID=UPI0030EEB839